MREHRGLIDTSVVIDLERIARDALPAELALPATTLTELDVFIAATAPAAGLPLYTRDPDDLFGIDALVETLPV